VSDTRLRRLWQRTIGRRSLIAQAHLDAFQDVRGPVDPSDLAALDAELRRTADGPWLPSRLLTFLGRDVYVNGRRVRIVQLPQPGMVIGRPRREPLYDTLGW